MSTASVHIAFQPLKKKDQKNNQEKNRCFKILISLISGCRKKKYSMEINMKQNIYYHQRECTKSDFDRKLVKCDTIQTQTKVHTKSKDFRTQNKSNLKF